MVEPPSTPGEIGEAFGPARDGAYRKRAEVRVRLRVRCRKRRHSSGEDLAEEWHHFKTQVTLFSVVRRESSSGFLHATQ
jgi:hypothetical protein